MNQITLVLPFALPLPDIAPDLARALQVPSLAMLTTRTATRRADAVDQSLRTLAHESWLARELGLSGAGKPAFAVQAMRHVGLAPGPGTWFIVNPTHIEIARSHLLLHDTRELRLTDADARALFDTAKPYFDEGGKTLLYGDASTWFMRADDWSELATASPDAAVGLNMTDFLPVGDKAREYRRLQNEIQMLWFGHPVNAAREARGLAPVNGFWPWGAATDTAASGAVTAAATAAPLAASAAPAWLAALTTARQADVDALLAGDGETTLVCADLVQAALAADWSSWLAGMQHLEQTVFAPILAALRAGQVRQVRLVVSHRTQQLDMTTTRLSLRAFWRTASLHSLLP